jgi:hypothetical protein
VNSDETQTSRWKKRRGTIMERSPLYDSQTPKAVKMHTKPMTSPMTVGWRHSSTWPPYLRARMYEMTPPMTRDVPSRSICSIFSFNGAGIGLAPLGGVKKNVMIRYESPPMGRLM